MPSKSKKQAKLMSAVAHNPEFANKVGIPQAVGKEFNEADQALKAEEVEKSNYGPKGAGLYDPTVNIERKKNNTGDVVGEGPNSNAKSYSTKPGQLSAKQQAEKMHSKKNIKANSGPVTKPTLTPEEIERYTKNMKKDEMLDVEADGKQELVEGKEPLKKDPKKRWLRLKKALDHNKAFMDLEGEMGEDEEAQPEAQLQPEQVPQGDPAAMQQAEQGGEEQAQPEEQPAQDGADSEAVSGGPEDMQPPEEQPEEGNGDVQPDPQELMDALKEEGYSDQEIAYIMHGHHAAEVDESKAAKADATRAMSEVDIDHAKRQADIEHSHNEQSLAAEREHKKRMQDLEFEQAQKKHALVDQDAAHKQRMSDIEYQQAQQANPQALEQEHKKRMLDLEYEKARKEAEAPDGSEDDAEVNKQMKQLEIEKKKLELQLRREEMKMELEFKKREHELKLKMMEQQIKEQAKQKGEISSIKHEQKLAEAKKPPAKKPLKKSEDEDDEGRDQ
jgi:hypothetical protein